jgi:hypothetical protein
MISTTSDGMVPPARNGAVLFHIIVDEFHRAFTIDGPDGPNGVRLHFDMLQAARTQKRRLRDFDLRLDSQQAALAEMQKHFPDYTFSGTWAESQAIGNKRMQP